MSKQVFTVGQVLTAAEMTTLQANDYNQTVSAKVASYVLVAADAGTRITMSNASATTVTVNTALFTAGDTLTITNIGVGVCTILAGTATVSTAGSLALNQYDSGTLYFTSTGVAIWNGANPGDITGVTAGTGLSGGGTSGTVSLAIDTAVTADLTTAQTLTNKTLTTPVINSPKISSVYTAKTSSYTFASGDEGNLFSMNNAATQQFNIPTDATFNFAVGTEINVFWITGAGQPTVGAVTPGTTTVISTGATSATPKLRVANSGATCKKLAANSWIVFGDLA